MAIEVYDSGTFTAGSISATPADMGADLDAAGVFVLRVDLTNLASGDTVSWYGYDGLYGDVVLLGTQSGDQSPDIDDLTPFVSVAAASDKLQAAQSAGTLRALPWTLYRIF